MKRNPEYSRHKCPSPAHLGPVPAPCWILLGLFCFLAAAQPGFSWTITHDNKVNFIWKSTGPFSAAYQQQSYKVTEKQPYDGVTGLQSGTTFTLNIRAGRKASIPVAEWFISRLNEHGAIAKYTLESATPEDLNFATAGRLTINGHQYEVVIGQGHGVYNNWWLGGRDLNGFCGRLLMASNDGRFIFEAIDQNTFHVTNNPAFYPDWMGEKVPDEALLSELSIPGTHDSATSRMNATAPINTLGVTQDFSILTQLNMGVRFLDIRLGFVNNTLNTFHGPFEAGFTFDSVVRQTFDFLRAHPGETVIMAIKKEHGNAGIEGPFFEVLRGHDSSLKKYWLHNRLPAMGEVRGKIVFIDRTSCINTGIEIKLWQDNCTFDSDGVVHFRIQDHYSFNLTSYSVKVSDIDQLLNEAIGGARTSWYLNFLSATSAKSLEGPKYIASVINPQVADILEKLPAGRVGTVVMDYAGEIDTPKIIRNIIERNGAK